MKSFLIKLLTFAVGFGVGIYYAYGPKLKAYEQMARQMEEQWEEQGRKTLACDEAFEKLENKVEKEMYECERRAEDFRVKAVKYGDELKECEDTLRSCMDSLNTCFLDIEYIYKRGGK